jgi:5-methylthioribose kinase
MSSAILLRNQWCLAVLGEGTKANIPRYNYRGVAQMPHIVRNKGATMIRTFITSNSEPLAPEAVAQMIASFKLRNPHLCDDVVDVFEDVDESPTGDDELPSDATAE